MAAPRLVVDLTIEDEDVTRLMAVVRSRTEPASRVERARMLLAYRDDPSFFGVGRLLGVHHQTVQRCIERAAAFGPLAALDDSARPGKTARFGPLRAALGRGSAHVPIARRCCQAWRCRSWSPCWCVRGQPRLPFSWPNNSLSRRSRGIAAMLMATNGPFCRLPQSCRARATSSLPAPGSPVIMTVRSVCIRRAKAR
jgi:hypothetical protein